MPFLLITKQEQQSLHLSRSKALLKAMDEQGVLPKEDGPPTGPQAQGQQQSPLEPQAHHEGNASLPAVPSPQHLQDQQLLAAKPAPSGSAQRAASSAQAHAGSVQGNAGKTDSSPKIGSLC